MEAIRKLKEEFQKQSAKFGPLAFYDAVVTNVDATEYTCDVILDEVEVYEVRLRAIISDKKSIDVLPKQGTNIVVGKLADDDYILIAADEITSYKLSIGSMALEVDETGFKIGSGTETLEKLLTDLVTATLSIAAPKDVATLTALKLRIKTILK